MLPLPGLFSLYGALPRLLPASVDAFWHRFAFYGWPVQFAVMRRTIRHSYLGVSLLQALPWRGVCSFFLLSVRGLFFFSFTWLGVCLASLFLSLFRSFDYGICFTFVVSATYSATALPALLVSWPVDRLTQFDYS